jgi:ribosome-associated protein YbcJ (S4-like RNA binding protein)
MKINIPIPCAEKYDNMSPTDTGRMCTICNTEVVDFTYWETKDIVTYIQKSNQKVCGRLNVQITEKHKFYFHTWIKTAGMISLLSLSKPLFSQTNKHEEVIINGEVKSNRGEKINYGYVTNNYNADTVQLDLNGNFQLKLQELKKNTPLIIKVTSLGFDTKSIELKNRINPTIILEETWIREMRIKKPLKIRLKRLFNFFSVKDEN